MRTFIYVALVGFLLVSGFLNLEKNEGQYVELPNILTNPFEKGERILPIEEWEETLIGTWEFTSQVYDHIFKGQVTYNDKSFIRKASYRHKLDDGILKSGGTVRGTWQVNENNTWTETTNKDGCVFSPAYNICSFFIGSNIYGKIESDTWDYDLIHFNDSRIEIRAKNLAGTAFKVYKFKRAKD